VDDLAVHPLAARARERLARYYDSI
jgi:hypothetical protein